MSDTAPQPDFTATFDSLTDAATRRAIIADPRRYAESEGLDVAGKEVVVATCTQDTLYIPVYQMPESGELSADELSGVSAAGSGTVSTVGSIGCVGTICSSLSSTSSAGTVGCQDPGG